MKYDKETEGKKRGMRMERSKAGTQEKEALPAHQRLLKNKSKYNNNKHHMVVFNNILKNYNEIQLIIYFIIIIIIRKGRQCKAERVIYTLSVWRPQPHNINLYRQKEEEGKIISIIIIIGRILPPWTIFQRFNSEFL